ncbi:hypothetical protein Pfo_001051 [Paulownia fortunei]|nr:hypothetical protein Pfo_001051 [Paulownia fortunei]
MGRTPCCSKIGLQKGPWTAKEDELLINYIKSHGEGHWRSLPNKAGLLRCGKSCRLRWMNYLRPDIKRGGFTPDEDDIIIKMHALLGNRWSLIAGRLPHRTDNEIKNYWNSHLSKKLRIHGTDPTTHKKLPCLVNVSSHNRVHGQKHGNDNNAANGNHHSYNKLKTGKYYCCKKNVEGEKVVVFNPKPIRVTTSFTHHFLLTREVNNNINNSFDTDIGSMCNSRGGENCKFTEAAWSNNSISVDDDNGISFVVNEDYHDNRGRVNGLGLNDEECHDYQDMRVSLSNNERTLEKVYEEYLQLLKTDENVDGRAS